MASNYLVYAEALICACAKGRKELSHHNKLDRAIVTAGAHWNLYVTFWGEHTHWLDIIVLDVRDGVMEWKNGHPLRKVEHGEIHDKTRPPAGGLAAERERSRKPATGSRREQRTHGS